MIYLQLRVKMADDEFEPFLQAFRAWERGRPEIEAAIVCEATGLTAEQVHALAARLDPPVPVRVIERWPDSEAP